MRSQIVLFMSLLVTLFNGVQLLAQSSASKNGPPQPNPDRIPPVDLSLPIDDNIVVLVIGGVSLGVYYAYSYCTAKKKAA